MNRERPKFERPTNDPTKPYMLFSYAGKVEGFRQWMRVVKQITEPIKEPQDNMEKK